MLTIQTTARPVMGLLERLKTYRVDWSKVAQRNDAADIPDYEPGIDREEADIDVANVVSSELRPRANFSPVAADRDPRHHVLAIDLDVPAYLVPSSTPGHNHLYVDIVIPHHRYMALLSALADAGVIERGYADVSIARGHSDLRLPWVRKGEATPAKAEPAPAVEPVPVRQVTLANPWDRPDTEPPTFALDSLAY